MEDNWTENYKLSCTVYVFLVGPLELSWNQVKALIIHINYNKFVGRQDKEKTITWMVWGCEQPKKIVSPDIPINKIYSMSTLFTYIHDSRQAVGHA